jgi:hypothetical protein
MEGVPLYEYPISTDSNGFSCPNNDLAKSKFLLQLLESSLYFRNTIIEAVFCCLIILAILCLPSKLRVRIIPSIALRVGIINLQFILQEFNEFLTDCLIVQNDIKGCYETPL